MNMEKADIKKKIHLALVALIFYIQKGTAFSTSPSALTSCASSTANISVNFSLNTGESIVGRRIWYFSGGKIAESNGTTLTPIPRYSSRLTAYGTSGISLSNSTVADAGTYTYVIILLPNGNQFTATTALSVQVAPLAPPSGCQVSSWNQPGNIPTCAVNTNSGNCGTPSLIASLVNSTNTSSQYICNAGETYQCCAASAALTCYSGSSNEFCKLFTCINATTDVTTNTTSTTTTTTITVTSSSLSSTSMFSTTFSATSATSSTFISTSPTTNQTSTGNKGTKSNICVRRKARKNIRESPDGMAIQDKGNNIDGWKQSFRHGKATNNIDTVYTTPDGFIIYPGPAAISTAGSYKDK